LRTHYFYSLVLIDVFDISGIAGNILDNKIRMVAQLRFVVLASFDSSRMDVIEYTITISCALVNRCFSEGANSVELQSLLFWLVATGIETEVVMWQKPIQRNYGGYRCYK